MREGEYIPANSQQEKLTESDKRINELAYRLDDIARGFSYDATSTITMADSEIPDKHAEINTEALANLKLRTQKLQELIGEIEAVAGIVDGEPSRDLLA